VASFAGKYGGRVDDLIAFLKARLEQDERPVVTARMRREIEAKRAIILQWEHSPPESPVLTNVLYQLAAIYVDHPGYRQEWKP